MKAFTHFLTPGGKASVVEEGPWHYGVDYVAAYFRGDRERLQQLLPPSLAVADGLGVAYVSEFVSVSEKNPEAPAENPAQTAYREGAIAVGCTYEGRPGLFFVFMWVDRDWSLIRGWLNGYPKKLADDIYMTRAHPLNDLAPPVHVGSRLLGYTARHGTRLLTVHVRVTRQGTEKDVIKFGATYGLRHFPATDSSQTAVSELVEVSKYNSRVSDVWVGDARVQLGQGANEELEFVGPTQILYGLHYRAGFVVSGAKVLRRLTEHA